MESTKPLIKNSRKKTLVIGSRPSIEYLKKNRFSRIAVVFTLADLRHCGNRSGKLGRTGS